MNEISKLTGKEGGQWKVFTQRSAYYFDLDAGTVTRLPGPQSSRSINDCERRILEIKACRVGQRGCWIMHPDGAEDTVEYFWQISTEIRQIERLPGESSRRGGAMHTDRDLRLRADEGSLAVNVACDTVKLPPVRGGSGELLSNEPKIHERSRNEPPAE